MAWQSVIHTLTRPLLQRIADPGLFMPEKTEVAAAADNFLGKFVEIRTTTPKPARKKGYASFISENLDLDISAVNTADEHSRPAPKFAKLRRAFERDAQGEVVVSKNLEEWYSSVPLGQNLTNSDIRKAQLELLSWELFDFQMRE